MCRTCHTWVHANPFEARSTGFIVSRHVDNPATEPVESYAGWMTLHENGTFVFVTE